MLSYDELKTAAAQAAPPPDRYNVTAEVRIQQIAGDGWGQDKLPEKKPWIPFHTETDDETAGYFAISRDARILIRVGEGPHVFAVTLDDLLTAALDKINTQSDFRIDAECAMRWISSHRPDEHETPGMLDAARLVASDRTYAALDRYGEDAIVKLLTFGRLVRENRIDENGEFISEEEEQDEIDPAERADPPTDDFMAELARKMIQEATAPEAEATTGDDFTTELERKQKLIDATAAPTAEAAELAAALLPWLQANTPDQTAMIDAAKLIAAYQGRKAVYLYGTDAITALFSLARAIKAHPEVKL